MPLRKAWMSRLSTGSGVDSGRTSSSGGVPVVADGAFGPKTGATAAFQQKYGLDDGVVGQYREGHRAGFEKSTTPTLKEG